MTGARRVLVVDDDVDIVKIVSAMLAGRGWRVATAHSGEEALAQVRDDPPDLVLLDIMMPRMNGLEVLRRLRGIAPATKIIMITAFGDVENYLDSLELGASEYVNKPFDSGELLAAIDKVVAV